MVFAPPPSNKKAPDLWDFGDGFLDEDESHQGGKALLREPGDVDDAHWRVGHQD